MKLTAQDYRTQMEKINVRLKNYSDKLELKREENKTSMTEEAFLANDKEVRYLTKQITWLNKKLDEAEKFAIKLEKREAAKVVSSPEVVVSSPEVVVSSPEVVVSPKKSKENVIDIKKNNNIDQQGILFQEYIKLQKIVLWMTEQAFSTGTPTQLQMDCLAVLRSRQDMVLNKLAEEAEKMFIAAGVRK